MPLINEKYPADYGGSWKRKVLIFILLTLFGLALAWSLQQKAPDRAPRHPIPTTSRSS